MKFSSKSIIAILILSTFFYFGCDSETVELSDHKWKATNVAGAAATKEKLANLTLEFREDQEIGGFAGCNEYRGGATYNQQQIKFSTLYTDNEICDDSVLERVFLKNLESGSTYTYQGSKLAIHDESGNIVVELEQI